MPTAGRVPKERSQIRHRNGLVNEWTEVENRPYPGPYPKLPAHARYWSPYTKRFYLITRRAPIAAIWDENDWAQVIECCEIHELAHLTGKPPHYAELRRRETELGLSWHARRAMRVRYVEPKTTVTSSSEVEDDERGNVIDLADYLKTF